ncbi:helix-turn-helix domain-containing protein [Lysinibacillus sp. NPDC096418]|uniref:helix-turn-helix domain-containing protein n=1 Tax=Lysinibacillus sp. NPDC096418 TaxID=3364138 RepID=UPI0038086D86
MTTGEAIRSMRMKLGLTQQQLADKVFVTRQTISKWELEKSVPDPISLELLDQVLNLTEVLNKNVQKGASKKMRIITNFIYVLLFGVLFLPFRFSWVKIKQNWKKPLFKFLIVPLVGILYLFYLHSLIDTVFYWMVAFSVSIYLLTARYFQEEEV